MLKRAGKKVSMMCGSTQYLFGVKSARADAPHYVNLTMKTGATQANLRNQRMQKQLKAAVTEIILHRCGHEK